MTAYARTQLLLGPEAMEKLQKSRVAVFGIGGVGGHAAEALVRSGIGSLDIIDSDKVCLTNLNRQIFATRKTIGQYKVDAAEERLLEIEPELKLVKWKTFYLPETADQFDFTQYDYIVDAVDTVKAKIALVENAQRCGTPVISSMGAGNKLDPTRFEVTDISKTSVCPLARVMRQELRRRGILHVKVVYSREEPVRLWESDDPEMKGTAGRPAPGSTAFVPSVAGLIMAAEVVKDLTT